MNDRKVRHELRQRKKLGLLIHSYSCSNRGECNYGQPFPREMEDDKSLPWPERQARAASRLAWYRHCQAAVNAENIAIRVRFGQGGRVKGHK